MSDKVKCQLCYGNFPSGAEWMVEQFPGGFGPAVSMLVVCEKHITEAVARPIDAALDPDEPGEDFVEPQEILLCCKVRRLTFDETYGPALKRARGAEPALRALLAAAKAANNPSKLSTDEWYALKEAIAGAEGVLA